MFSFTLFPYYEKKARKEELTCALKVSFSAPVLLDLITQLLTRQPFWAANGKFDNGVRLFWSPAVPALCLRLHFVKGGTGSVEKEEEEEGKKTQLTVAAWSFPLVFLPNKSKQGGQKKKGKKWRRTTKEIHAYFNLALFLSSLSCKLFLLIE